MDESGEDGSEDFSTQPPSDWSVEPPNLVELTRQGRRRRRRRTAAIVGVTFAVATVGFGATWAMVSDGDHLAGSVGADSSLDATDVPSPAVTADRQQLLTQVDAEVPGAQRIGDSTIVVPAPKAVVEADDGSPATNALTPIGTRSYLPIAWSSEDAWPSWLYKSSAAVEENASNGQVPPVLMDMGPQYLTCLKLTDSATASAGCRGAVALVHKAGEEAVVEVTLGTKAFLKPGQGMEVFTLGTIDNGAAAWLILAGLSGDVAKVEFVDADGNRTAGQVDRGSVAPGASLMWATMPTIPRKVTAYDVGGNVLEDHELVSCESAVECEVR